MIPGRLLPPYFLESPKQTLINLYNYHRTRQFQSNLLSDGSLFEASFQDEGGAFRFIGRSAGRNRKNSGRIPEENSQIGGQPDPMQLRFCLRSREQVQLSWLARLSAGFSFRAAPEEYRSMCFVGICFARKNAG